MTVTLLTISGTWAKPWEGFSADLARAVTDEFDDIYAEVFGLDGPEFRWLPVEYPASFGPVAGNGPSYADSVQGGRDNTKRKINELVPPGNKFALTGYSQGAEVVGWVCYDLVAGDMRHRKDDCVGSITFGDPTRQPSDIAFGGGKGWGISRLVIPPGLKRITYALPGDIYCTNPDTAWGDNNYAMYKALTRLGARPEDVINAILQGDNALAEQLWELLLKPAGGIAALIQSLLSLTGLGAHGGYAPWVAHAADQLRALGGTA